MFMMAPTILRPASLLSAILKPQDVVAILAQPANAMQAAINALPFSPDILIGKDRVAAGDWAYRDSLRGLNLTLASNTTAAETTWPGYSGTNNRIEYAFKQQAGVIWRVTWTGDGTGSRQIPHGLGVVPGMVIAKIRNGASFWTVSHRSLASQTSYLKLNANDAVISGSGSLLNGSTASTFTVGNELNSTGDNIVAYLIAHDPSADGIVQCGSFTNANVVNLGWSPQFLMFKRTDAAEEWWMVDTARGWASGIDKVLQAQSSGAEINANFGAPTATGFSTENTLGSYIYLAIRAPY